MRPVEKKQFEDLFGMSGGYVLDFKNQSFAAFFRDTVNVDIYSSRFSRHGSSKANRLRAFWDAESDQRVGKVLLGLLEYWEYAVGKPTNDTAKRLYAQCQKVASNLAGVAVKADPESEFLQKDFGAISIDRIQIDASLLPILKSRLVEAGNCLRSNSPLAAIFMCGSILEGLLMGVAIQNPKAFNQASASPKDKAGKVRQFHEWTLSQFIEVAHELGFLALDVKKFGHALRDFRNYIHPYEQMASNFSPDSHTAQICLQVLKAAIASLSGDRKG